MALSTATAAATVPRHRCTAAPPTSFSCPLTRTLSPITSSSFPKLFFSHNHRCPPLRHLTSVSVSASASASAATTTTDSATRFHGPCYVVADNIDTDQIIPAEYLTLVPSKPDEYQKLGSLALIGLPSLYPRFVAEGHSKTDYPIVIAGANFGCGSSREHAPVALGASGVKAVVAESYARIFFRNSVATGEVYPIESEARICEECRTGDVITVDLSENSLVNHTTGKVYALKPIGDAGPVIQAGGIFAYARKTGMIASV
ncbi:3-isopropylmalate dehydratase small subunit 1-like [Nymphaea colorata]|uniref:3-isopropylmalate dehydratase n=1 Tax=Nymphaea colorata TaxID=210225 RepID=A0A5K0WYB1_9MAGN|nr:3-isopropylmalate dehydratase small subunit 1-like [Nymphaea colorata]